MKNKCFKYASCQESIKNKIKIQMKTYFSIAALTSTLVSALELGATNVDGNGDKQIFIGKYAALFEDEKTISKVSASGEIATYTVHKSVSDEGYNNYEAEEFCRENGGELASIHNQEENEAITKLAKAHDIYYLWIGLKFNIDEG